MPDGVAFERVPTQHVESIPAVDRPGDFARDAGIGLNGQDRTVLIKAVPGAVDLVETQVFLGSEIVHDKREVGNDDSCDMEVPGHLAFSRLDVRGVHRDPS